MVYKYKICKKCIELIEGCLCTTWHTSIHISARGVLFQQKRTSNNMNNFKVNYVIIGRTSNDKRAFEFHSFNRCNLQMTKNFKVNYFNRDELQMI